MKRKNKSIKVIRKYPYEELGIFASQREVARILNVNEGTVSRWISGSRNPKDYILEVIETQE